MTKEVATDPVPVVVFPSSTARQRLYNICLLHINQRTRLEIQPLFATWLKNAAKNTQDRAETGVAAWLAISEEARNHPAGFNNDQLKEWAQSMA